MTDIFPHDWVMDCKPDAGPWKGYTAARAALQEELDVFKTENLFTTQVVRNASQIERCRKLFQYFHPMMRDFTDHAKQDFDSEMEIAKIMAKLTRATNISSGACDIINI